jgi:hypothetical protein
MHNFDGKKGKIYYCPVKEIQENLLPTDNTRTINVESMLRWSRFFGNGFHLKRGSVGQDVRIWFRFGHEVVIHNHHILV